MTNKVNIVYNSGSADALLSRLGFILRKKNHGNDGTDSINKDIPRTLFLYSQNLGQELIKSISSFIKNTNGYMQGDLTGRNIVSTTLGQKRLRTLLEEMASCAPNSDNLPRIEEKIKNSCKQYFDFCYLNNERVLSGLSFHFSLINQSWALTVTKNLNLMLNQKKQVLFINNYPDSSIEPNETITEPNQVLKRIKKEINNKQAFNRIEPFIKSDNSLNLQSAQKFMNLDNTELASTKITISHQKKTAQQKAKRVLQYSSTASLFTGASAGSIIGGTVKSAGCVLLAKHGLFSAPGIIIGAKSALVAGFALGISAGLSGIVIIGLAVALWYATKRLCANRKLHQHSFTRGINSPIHNSV